MDNYDTVISIIPRQLPKALGARAIARPEGVFVFWSDIDPQWLADKLHASHGCDACSYKRNVVVKLTTCDDVANLRKAVLS